ncbi:MAG: alpha/beta hydrolase [Alphaproteobacteria bacterium]|nr:alpha/beta hydrolase [Alphaproteobacteria bacterium]
MPAVFVHGVPDTARVWRPLLAQLKRSDVVCLSLPGFGNRRPAGFHADKDSYAAWLLAELRKLDGPIDLVGHDWGSLLVTRVVSIAPPGLVRSWSGGGAPLDPGYVWHDTAQIWQTPGKGEELMQMMSADLMAAGLAAQGIPPEEARETAQLMDDEMKASILTLYRSAIRVADEWFADLKNVTAPGLVLWGENDPYAAAHFGAKLAANTNAEFTPAPGAGHWYQIEKPVFVADALSAFWAKHR